MTGSAESWLWLFPLTYAVHIAEEGLGGERFYRWIRRVPLVPALGIQVSGREFVALNALYMIAMIAAVVAASSPQRAWVAPGLGVLVALNGLGHLAGSLATRSYSPGLVSGMLLWFPLGLFTLADGQRTLPPSAFWSGVIAGILAQAFIAAILLLPALSKRHPGLRSP